MDDRYQIRRFIARGGFGDVYEAIDLRFSRDDGSDSAAALAPPGRQMSADQSVRMCVVKILQAEKARDHKAIARFRSEALAAARLDSLHTARIYDFKQDHSSGAYFIAMEYVSGPALGSLLKKHGPLTVNRALRLTRHVCKSLAEAHAKRLIHRDITPNNVMLTREPGGGEEIAKLVDFGQAKDLGSASTSAVKTQTHMIMGTPQYLSPEQTYAGIPQRPAGYIVDHRTDLYQVGCILFAMLAGRPPFQSTDPYALIQSHRSDKPPRVSDVTSRTDIPEDVEQLVARLLAKHPDERPQSAIDIIAVLDSIQGLTPEHLRTELIAARPLRAGRWPPRSVLVGIAALLPIAAGLVWWAMHRPDLEAPPVDRGVLEAVRPVEAAAPAPALHLQPKLTDFSPNAPAAGMEPASRRERWSMSSVGVPPPPSEAPIRATCSHSPRTAEIERRRFVA